MSIHDLLLAGGHVVDVGGGHVGRFDVAVRGGRIAAVAPALPAGSAREVVDAGGHLVTPGLVDLHTHVHPGATYWGIHPDPVAWHSGVTTWVDAGSAGAWGIDALRAAVETYRVRVPVLLNVSALGLTGRTGESTDLAHVDVDAALDAIARHPDLVAGVKARIDRETAGGNGLRPLERALDVARAAGLPLMVHVAAGPPGPADVLPLLRPGDILTHCASGVAATGAGPAVREAYARGVLLDVGHGAGGFAFDVLAEQLAAGLPPHTVSTDLHARCRYGPVFDLPTTMAKLRAAGMALDEVVAAATANPAAALRLPGGVGTLAVGAPADMAVFAVEQGAFPVVDAHGQVRQAPERLRNVATYVAGRRLPPSLPEPPPPWVPLTRAQRAALDRREQALRDLLGEPLVGPEGLTEQFPR
ncbi:amidohydrolase/deacetylase family metallohydrolase [Phytohabitans sp. ZYX-F-186]|uniref:Amidohydrolase/deacetylase family metallohydrolase n=1 Tax=Phytohabitans maris TaxID=3071409 RepID=A0ABU0ZXM6_9ACTN|nr:amidohydrolase/deacetylase family metallohydrolase [Phytohabitans sp. ZYX-F-186]MDQ7910732.1 amidohydrolase/deacetylase family metallohydrolase [Phytohabitans sp. ZYX-F-186]